MLLIHICVIGVHKGVIGVHKSVLGVHTSVLGVHKSVITSCCCLSRPMSWEYCSDVCGG